MFWFGVVSVDVLIAVVKKPVNFVPSLKQNPPDHELLFAGQFVPTWGAIAKMTVQGVAGRDVL
jgi:hypothetical protein